MADSDYNSLQPVESLHNIHGLTPAQQRKERRRRQDLPAESQKSPEQEEEEEEQEEEQSDVQASDEGESHSIDYCA